MGDGPKELAGVGIVVIDDSRTVRHAVKTMLERAGARVFSAADGFEALALIADSRPALIFADVMMPRLDGYQTCARIKNNPEFRDIPVILLSAKDGPSDVLRGRLAGAVEYLTKPFTEVELLGVVRRYLPERLPVAD